MKQKKTKIIKKEESPVRPEVPPKKETPFQFTRPPLPSTFAQGVRIREAQKSRFFSRTRRGI